MPYLRLICLLHLLVSHKFARCYHVSFFAIISQSKNKADIFMTLFSLLRGSPTCFILLRMALSFERKFIEFLAAFTYKVS